MKFNLSKFKKMSEDKHHTVLQNPEGHEIKIAHKSLSPKLRAQIEGIPLHKAQEEASGEAAQMLNEGGEAISYGANSKKPMTPQQKKDAEDMAKGFQKSGWDRFVEGVKHISGKADGGEVTASPELEELMKPAAPIPVADAAGVPAPQQQKPSPGQEFRQLMNKAEPAFAPPPQSESGPKIEKGFAESVMDKASNAWRLMNDFEDNLTVTDPNASVQDKTKAYKRKQEWEQAAQENKVIDVLKQKQAIDEYNLVAPPDKKIPYPPELLAQMGQQPQPQATGLGGQGPGPANLPGTKQPGAEAAQGDMMGSYQGSMQKGYGLQVQGIEQKAAADAALGREKAEVAAQTIAKKEQEFANWQKQRELANQERQNFIDDIKNGYIKPNQYMENMSAFNKVRSAIGILISGMSGASNNVAMDFLQKQIDRDIAAQKDNLGMKNNLLTNNLQQYKNIDDAINMTRVQLNDIYAHEIDQAVAKNMTPQAQAAAKVAKGQLMQQNSMWLSQIGGINGGAGRNQIEDYLNVLRLTSPEKAKELEARYIPGVGLASIPVETKDREALAEGEKFKHMVEKLQSYTDKYAGTFRGFIDPSMQAETDTIRGIANDLYRKKSNGGTFKEGEKEFIEGIMGGNPTSLFAAWTTKPKYKVLLKEADLERNALLNRYGIRPTQGSGPGVGEAPKIKSFKPNK